MIDPSHNLISNESDHLFLCYCTFVSNLKGKKLSTQNVFIHTLDEPKLKNILKDILNLETDYEVVRVFLDFDPTICKSKFISKWVKLNNKEK